MRRIREASIDEKMHEISNDIYRLKSIYQQSIEQQQFFPTDPLTSNLENRKCFFMVLEREMKTMNMMLNKQDPEAKNLNAKLGQFYNKELDVRVDTESSTYNPPGELSKEGIKRA